MIVTMTDRVVEEEEEDGDDDGEEELDRLFVIVIVVVGEEEDTDVLIGSVAAGVVVKVLRVDCLFVCLFCRFSKIDAALLFSFWLLDDCCCTVP